MAVMRSLHGWPNMPRKRLILVRFTKKLDLFGNEIPEGGNPLRMPQLLGVGEEYRNLV
jgi:hypothetical protein